MRRTISLLAIVPVLVATVLSVGASADAVYPSQHIALTPVGDQPLSTGFVENIHANGPIVFAMERYVLVGASPRTTYSVKLNIWFDTTCPGSADIVLQGISFTTNTIGNGVGMVRFSPADADGLHGATVGIVWTLSIGASVAYTTACSLVTLD